MPDKSCGPQWSPVLKTGKTTPLISAPAVAEVPQWSPVLKTGKTPADWEDWSPNVPR